MFRSNNERSTVLVVSGVISPFRKSAIVMFCFSYFSVAVLRKLIAHKTILRGHTFEFAIMEKGRTGHYCFRVVHFISLCTGVTTDMG